MEFFLNLVGLAVLVIEAVAITFCILAIAFYVFGFF